MTSLPTDLCLRLAPYHPVFIEGMGSYDERQPAHVAGRIVEQLIKHWAIKPPGKPLIIMIQGDPPAARGISAITPLVANDLGVSRCLVCLDNAIADYHAENADRKNVSLELRYSQLLHHLPGAQTDTLKRIEWAVDEELDAKNQRRKALGKPQLEDYFRSFALLQEVTKAACAALCDGVTVIHTSATISEFSVTSFYTVGLALNLVNAADMVSFGSNGCSDSVDPL